jgi:uncharacterized membrane protein YuzA (DUF378 family)
MGSIGRAALTMIAASGATSTIVAAIFAGLCCIYFAPKVYRAHRTQQARKKSFEKRVIDPEIESSAHIARRKSQNATRIIYAVVGIDGTVVALTVMAVFVLPARNFPGWIGLIDLVVLLISSLFVRSVRRGAAHPRD